MKALILAGGRGKRINKISREKNKCMIEIKNRPLLDYNLDYASRLDISEIIVVVGYKAEEIINTFGNRYKGKPINYVVQPEQKGLVNAIESAQETIKKEDFILILGDELMINPRRAEMIKEFLKKNLFALCGVVQIKDKNLIKKTYTIIQDKKNRIFRLIEKPNKPMNNIMGTGNVVLKNEILSYIPQTPINQKRGEKELVDLIQCAVDDGQIDKSFVICDKYFNINSPEEMEKAKSYFAHF